MKTLCIEINPQTDFSGQIKGDTFFSLLCGFIAEKQGQNRINGLLENYLNQPFMVVSDFFPHHYLPRPQRLSLTQQYSRWYSFSGSLTLPQARNIPPKNAPRLPVENISAENRKDFKQKKWILRENIEQNIDHFEKYLTAVSYQETVTRMHNAVNPQTGLVDSETYAPYPLKQTIYFQSLDIYIIYNENMITDSEILEAVTDIGLCGIGRGASRGVGKFQIESVLPHTFKSFDTPYYMTLSPCVPEPNVFDAQKSYYKTFTRFGKRSFFNEQEARYPFKRPILTADTGAVFCLQNPAEKLFIGRGLNNIADNQKVVYQGYAPVVPLLWREINE